MKILLASSNPHKLDEIRAVFAEETRRAGAGRITSSPGASAIELLSLRDLNSQVPEPVEDQATFEANAMLKARYYAQGFGLCCLADDSGLEVDALGGEPGVRSARYAEVNGPRSVVDPANNHLLLEKLANVPSHQRTARFVCAMALAGTLAPGAREVKMLAVVRGTVEGRILLPQETADPTEPHRGRGLNGFGYDPLFLIPELGKTTAELSPEQKNAISHRGRAARLMWGELSGGMHSR